MSLTMAISKRALSRRRARHLTQLALGLRSRFTTFLFPGAPDDAIQSFAADQLDRKRLASALRDLIASPGLVTPITIDVYGGWVPARRASCAWCAAP
jgi:hypothetical protein